MTSIHTLYSDDTALPFAELPYLLRCVDAGLGCLFSSKPAVGSNLTGLVSYKPLIVSLEFSCVTVKCSVYVQKCTILHRHTSIPITTGNVPLMVPPTCSWKTSRGTFWFSKVEFSPLKKNSEPFPLKHKILFTSHHTVWVEIVSSFSNSVTLRLYFLSWFSLCRRTVVQRFVLRPCAAIVVMGVK